MNHQRLLDAEDRLVTDLGKAFLTERVVMRGRDLHHDLRHLDWFRLYLFSITGREFTDTEMRLLNYIWVGTSYPDASIWPNHVAALAGSARSTSSLALSSGMTISEASVYGRRPDRRGLDFFYRAGRAMDQGQALEDFVEEELKRYKRLYGYGRPLARIDERIPHLLKFLDELGMERPRHLCIALEVYHYLNRTRGLSINISAACAALGADFGLSPEEYQLFLTPCFIAGMVPCYIDARDKPEGSFFPIRCDSIRYEGRPRRSWDGG